MIAYNWSREIDELLVNKHANGDWEYATGLNEAEFWDNVILGKSNDKIDAFKKGYELNIGDCYYLRRGKYEDTEGKVFLTSKGWGINYMQLIKIPLRLFFPEPSWVKDVIYNMDFEEHYAEYETEESHPLEGTKYRSYVIRLGVF